MAYRFSNLVQSWIEFALGPMALYTFGPYTMGLVVNFDPAGLSTNRNIFVFMDSSNSTNKVTFRCQGGNLLQMLQGGSSIGPTATLGSVWYTIAITRAAGSSSNRYHVFNGTSWTHSASSTNTITDVAMIAGDRFRVGIAPGSSGNLVGDVVCAGIKKTDSTDLQVETLGGSGFPSWQAYGFDWLARFDNIATRTNVANPGSGDETSRGTALTLVADPPPPWTWSAAPVADFTGTPLTGVASYTVTFTDASTNTPTSWAWTFGDGGTSTSQNPTHSYTVPGVYTVVLVATNAGGSDTKTRTGYINVGGGFVPQIIWFTPAPATGVPAAPTFESATAYSTVANRPAVTGTTRPFASSAALTGALNAASPGDLVQYTGAGILDIAGNYSGFCGRRYTGYVNIDLGLPGSANHVRFTGGGGAGLPAVAIYNSAFLRIYGGEITNPAPKTTGYDGLHIYGAQNPSNGSTNHIVWWNLLVHDTVDSGIKMLPNVVSGGGNAADNTIADCDIQAEVYRIGLDKTVDTSHAERGTGQHCCLLADTDPAGATYPSFLRNRVAIDGHDTGLTSSQGGGSVIELGFNDSLSTISGCTLIIRGANTMFNAQQQTGGNGLNLWGDAQAGVAIPFLQHSNATGSPVCNPGGTNRPGVVVAYGRHTATNQNAYEGVVPWQIGPTYRDVA